MIIEDYLRKNALLYPQKTAVIFGKDKYTYKQLLDASIDKSHEYNESGKLIPFRFTPTIDALVNYFAIHMADCVAVPLDKALPDSLFEDYLSNLTSAKVPTGTADVLFTTGTTGKSKGVIISHDAIVADTENLVDRLEYKDELTFIIHGPLNHIASLSKIYPMIYVGGTILIMDGLKDISSFLGAIAGAEGKVATFLVPANIRMLLQFAKKELSNYVEKIDFIETGAAPLSQVDMEEISSVLPHSRLYNTYASTETGIISSFNYNGECVEGCLGRPMKHSDILIGDDGLVICKGKTLMSGYLGDEELTKSVMRDGMIFTSDIGELDSMGRLHLKGRKDDVINVGGFKVSPSEVESIALTFSEIKDCICIQAVHPILKNCLKLLYVADNDIEGKAIALYMKNKLEPHKIPLSYERVEKINRTFNGKLDRKSYK